MKFIHLSDLHLVPPGRELHGLWPDERLEACVSHIAREHGDAAFCVVSGDLTHDGNPLAYAEAARILSCLPMLNRTGFVGGSHFQIGWSHDEQNDEQVLA